ncbi:TPA: hypothetical protein I8235_000049 [Kluyvera intermedia]|nr:hypothetical protein [Kluyvera intermedia]
MKSKLFPLLFILAPFASSAIVLGGTNLGYMGYPEFSEVAPSRPYSDDQYSMEEYRRQVANYTAKAKEYLENSNADIKRIQEAQEDAINKANAAVRQYNAQ